MTDWKQKAKEAWEQPGWGEAARKHHDLTPEPPQSKWGDWPEPKPLPTGLLPVEPFRSEFMPAALAPWVDDISERLQCPADYVAVASIVALGSVIGRRIGIKPQARTDWLEVPNLWGCFIGRPGMLKSPAMMAALKPIHRLEKEAAKSNEVAREAFAANMDVYKLQKQVKAALARDRLKEKMQEAKHGAADFEGLDLGKQPKEPVDLRYRTNDTSYEKLGELLLGNPAGVLIERDELVSLLVHLDQEQQAVARGFYLSGWSGTQPYTFDRIGRGTVHLDAICISVLGNTQPVRIAEYVRRANAGGAGGDGLIQRFGLLVWPDQKYEWSDVDRYPESKAREAVWETFERASKLDLTAALSLGAHKGQFDDAPFLRFTDEARREFLGWREPMERTLRTGGLSPALEGHLAKFRKVVPALAIINHIADGGHGDVTQVATVRALAFAGYLESHARRVYASGLEAETAAAKAILKHICSGDLQDGFTARDIHQRGWAHLTERDHVGLGLHLLEDHDFIRAEPLERGRAVAGPR
jgi:putative DNA primase/helicase